MTPLIKFENIYFKREDQNPTGSAKDRSLPLQLKNLLAKNYQSAVISSSGNAAISAIFYCRKLNIPLKVFLSPQTDPYKLKLILSQHQDVTLTPSPNSLAFKYAKTNHSYLLRQSTDPVAQIGYSTIATEIVSKLPLVSSIFIPVGSGTTLLGVSKNLPQNVKIFAVEPASRYGQESETITDALSVKLTPLKSEVAEAIKKHHGSNIIVRNQAVLDNLKKLHQHQINTSPEGALALTGYYQAKTKFEVGDYPVILLTGINRQI
ncbi:MAG: PLP-dependent lyase/thiolase [Candidatus Shapirobacteria bacterium]|jgi:threonine dehydratase